MREYNVYMTVGATKRLTRMREVRAKMTEMENNGHEPLRIKRMEKPSLHFIIVYYHKEDLDGK